MKRIAGILVFLLFLGFNAIGQQIQITGKVTSADDGGILPGVSVVIKGTTSGVASNINGDYSIQAPSDAILVFSSVGFQSQEVAVEGRTTINVVMQTEVAGLEEVVVVGYGVSTFEALTGSVAVMKSDDFADIPEVTFEKMLDGKVAGVQITGVTGQPGAQSQVRVRGISSINAGREPLYVVDGIPIIPNQDDADATYMTNTSNTLAIVNPNDIESVSVLKDASAAAIYGSRAANGVILITTKSGKSAKSKINFKLTHGYTALANDNGFDILTPEQLITLRQDAVRNIGGDPNDPTSSFYTPDSLLQLPMTNWLKETTRTGNQNEVDLSVTGGNEKTQHFLSGRYTRSEGVFYGVAYESFQFRSNIDHAISDKLNVGVKLNGFHSKASDVAMQSLYYVNPIFASPAINPYTPIYNEDGTVNLNIPEWSNTNPIASALYDEQWEKQNRAIAHGTIEWEIIKNLKLNSNNGLEYTDTEGRRYWSPEADNLGEATLQTTQAQFIQLTTSNTVSYSLIKGSHFLNLLAGTEIADYRDNYYYLYSPDVNGDIPYPNTSPSDGDDADYDVNRYTMASFFGILDYNYDSKYFFRASIREDGSSKFGSNYRWGLFYSFGASWSVSKESFMQNANFIDILKLRANYGVSGNDQIGYYDHWGTYAPVQYNGISGMAPSLLANPDLSWENNQAYNIALDFGFFNKIDGSIDFYNKVTTDMLLDVPVSHTSGFTSMTQNIGSLRNRGVEFILDFNIIRSSVIWNIGFNIAANRTNILDLYVEEGEFISTNNRMIYREGEQILSYYLYDYAGVNPVNGEALWYDESGKITNLYGNARRIIAGSPEPKYMGGFSTDISFKGISFAATFAYKFGNDVLIEELHYLNSDGYWFNNNQVNTQLDYWKEPGDITRNPKPLPFNSTNSNGFFSPRWMFNGSYLRIKNLTLAYTLPESITNKVRISNLRIYTSALNLYTFHDVDWWDPERGEEGMGFGIYPMTKGIVFGLDVTF